jgi:DNA-binding transcriptional LysR family regulator
MDRFAEMKAFCAVAAMGGFTPAARAMGLAPSSVTRLVDALERRLGAVLLNRSTRSVTLTDSGRVYYDESQRILEQLDSADEAVTDCASGVAGTLRVAAPVTFAARCIAPILPEMRTRYPRLKLDLQLDDAAVNLTDESIDVAIRIGSLDPTINLVARRLSEHTRMLCASPAYLALHGMPDCPADLGRHDCLQFSYAENRRMWRLRRNDGNAATPLAALPVEEVAINSVMIANNAEVLRQAALGGLGIAMLAQWLVQADVQAGRLVRVLDRYDANPGPMDVAVHALYQPSQRGSKKIAAFVDLLAVHLQ